MSQKALRRAEQGTKTSEMKTRFTLHLQRRWVEKWHRSLWESDSGYSKAVFNMPKGSMFSKAAECLRYVDGYLKANCFLCS